MMENKHEYLAEEMKKTLSESRYLHTLSVKDEAEYLASLILPEKKEAIITAALLHDCTKMLDTDAHLALARCHGLTLCEDDLRSVETLHAITGALVAADRYGCDEDVCRMISSHSVGREMADIGEKIVMLADYVEPTRRYDDCKRTARFIHSSLERAKTSREREEALDKALMLMLTLTIRHLNQKNAFIHPESLRFLERLKAKYPLFHEEYNEEE